jgi:hypothetical protein
MYNPGRKYVQVMGAVETTYILLNGISVGEAVALGENIELLPADTSHLDFRTAVSTVTHPDDIAVVAAFIPRISAQFKVSAATQKQLAIAAWNSSWDALLLSAIFHTEIGFNLQSDTESTAIGAQSRVWATNHHMRGMTTLKPHALTTDEMVWIRSNFSRARDLLREENFQTAVHCLASYRWHSMPRIKLAVLWAGIECLFKVTSEIRFRISLYIALFLHPDNPIERKETFDRIKKLYDSRSAAVHGGKLKDTAVSAVEASAQVLQKLILQCIGNGSVPIESDLVP